MTTKRQSGHLTDRYLERRVRWRVQVAWAVAWWEAVWSALWPIPAIVGVFIALAWSDLLPLLGATGHTVVLAGFALWLSIAAIRSVRRFRHPTREQVERRIERASGLRHRPLAALQDPPSAADMDARALRAVHLRAIVAALRRLRLPHPRSPLPTLDPRGFRAAVLLLVIVAGVSAWGELLPRLGQALQPAYATVPEPVLKVDLWVEPPPYTGVAPIYAGAGRTELGFPEGSAIVVRVAGLPDGAPAIAIDDEKARLEAAGGGEFSGRFTVEHGDRLAIVDGSDELAAWTIRVEPDMPPSVAFTHPPTRTARGALRIDYAAEDDYGVVSLAARVEPADLDEIEDGTSNDGDSVDIAPTPEPLDLRLPVGRDAQAVEGMAFHDLTAHRWAGRPVHMHLLARDAADQKGESEAVTFLLPERQFTHPVSRILVELRKRLAVALDMDRDVRETAFRVADRLQRLGYQPGLYDGDTVVHLALASGRSRLRHDPAERGIEAVRDLLWDTALRLEDGGLSLAERELRAAQQELMEALAENAPQEEIDSLIEQLRQAIQQLARHMAQHAEDMPELHDDHDMQSVTSQELSDMLDDIRELSRSGAHDAAQEMLAQLQQMLESLQNARMAGQDGELAEQMMQTMENLRELSDLQRQLMDETFRQAQQQGQQGEQGQPEGRPGQQGGMQGWQQGMPQPGEGPARGDGTRPPSGPGLERPGGDPAARAGEGARFAERQEELRRMLGDVMRQVAEMTDGRIPGQLGRAERSMNRAVGQLESSAPGPAVDSQSEAIDHLQEAARSLGQQLARQLGQQPGQQGAGRQRGGQGTGETDPLGRNDGYGGDLEGRMRFPLEVASIVREAWPAHLPVWYRVSAQDGVAGGLELAEVIELCRRLKAIGIDLIDCSSGGISGSPSLATVHPGPGFQVPFADAIRREAGIATMAVGFITEAEQAEAILAEGKADMIAIAREHLADPAWAYHAALALGAPDAHALLPHLYHWYLERRAALTKG